MELKTRPGAFVFCVLIVKPKIILGIRLLSFGLFLIYIFLLIFQKITGFDWDIESSTKNEKHAVS